MKKLQQKILINVGPNLADKIPPNSKKFVFYLQNITTALCHKPLTEKEFKDAIFKVKTK